MQTFSGYEYLLIDVATNYPGLDKLIFPERIQWAQNNLTNLEALGENTENWKEKPLYIKAVQALRDAQDGIPTGHLVSMDAVCSGLQIMSVVTGCFAGAKATGLIDQDRRADAYTECTAQMTEILGHHMNNERSKVKQALMTAFYGSRQEPINEFGDGTPELAAFYEAMFKLGPGAVQLLSDLLESWQPYALVHEWHLPDGFHARVKVLQKTEHRIEVDELDHKTFTYTFYENEGEKSGVKNAANIVHSLDGYVLRSLIRRCSYNAKVVSMAQKLIVEELLYRMYQPKNELETTTGRGLSPKVAYYLNHAKRSQLVDPVILDHLSYEDIVRLPSTYLRKINILLNNMLEAEPFEVVTIHDDFKCHPNNMNTLRYHYKEILADIADSNVIGDILSQLHKLTVTTVYPKLTPNLGTSIRQSNYHLC